jgi:putative transposase
VDTLGLLLRVKVHAANIQDRAGIALFLEQLNEQYPLLTLIWGDCGYSKTGEEWVEEHTKAKLEVVKRPSGSGFQVLHHRWIVERTFAWLNRNRQLSKEWDLKAEHTEGWIWLSMIRLMTRRLTNTTVNGYDPQMKKNELILSMATRKGPPIGHELGTTHAKRDHDWP